MLQYCYGLVYSKIDLDFLTLVIAEFIALSNETKMLSQLSEEAGVNSSPRLL